MRASETDRWTEHQARAALADHEGIVRRIARSLGAVARGTRLLDEEDLRAVGRVAVLEALARYEGVGANPSTWVAVRVRQRMIDALRRHDLRSRAEARAIREAEPSELDRELRLAAARTLVSLDGSEIGADGAAGEALPLSRTIAAQRSRRLRRAIETLPERQRTALTMTLFDGLPPGRVSEQLGVSASRISQLQRQAVAGVRAAMCSPQCMSVAPSRTASISDFAKVPR